MKKIILLLFIYLQLCTLLAQVKKDVLFIGNSYTEVNNLPQLTSLIANSKGDTLIYDSNTPGGYTFQLHSTNPATIGKINSKDWDYVVLQEQSQLPSFPPEQVLLLVYPYADSLNRLIKTNDTCTITSFFMTWGRKNGDSEYCPVYPPVCTFDGMQSRLRQSYLEMGQIFDANVTPVGIVWKKTRDFHPEIELYESDGSHPSLAGSYLAACTFYASLFHKSPVGAYIPSGLNLNYAQIIQNYASQVVFDSLETWNIDTTSVYADFLYNAFQFGRVEFTNTSQNANSYFWDFGDGNYSTDINPVHIYQFCGTTYNVSLTAYNSCKVDLFQKEIMVPCNGINEITDKGLVEIFPNPASNILHIIFNESLSNIDCNFILYDGNGIEIIKGCFRKSKNSINLPEIPDGFYFIQLNVNGKIVNKKIQIFKGSMD